MPLSATWDNRAPTEGGSSGSPVFNSRLWQVIALHHKGGKTGMSQLNGKPGTYAANEGVSIASIIAAMRAEFARAPNVA
jgi:V8-like Glu-specific endopeptidase